MMIGSCKSGYGQAAAGRDLHAAGVRTVAIPRQATTSPPRKAVEHGRGLRRLVKWRTGCEGRISYLKRGYGWARVLVATFSPRPARQADV